MSKRVASIALAFAAGTAFANDRPFQYARTAVMEDDEQVWSIESWIERRGPVRGLSVEPEYTFDVADSIQWQFSRYLDSGAEQTGHEAELEYKRLFNPIGRDGWGLGFSAAVGVERSAEGGTLRRATLKLPFSLALGDSVYLHLNPGIMKASAEPRAWTAAVAIEGEVWRRTTAFAELAHEGALRYGQVGARYWLRRERIALDVGWQQYGGDGGRRERGLIVGLGLYDL